jgi:hypothetical protein
MDKTKNPLVRWVWGNDQWVFLGLRRRDFRLFTISISCGTSLGQIKKTEVLFLRKAIIDRVVAVYPDVSEKDFQRFFDELDYLETHGFVEKTERWVEKAASKYHYNIRVGKGEGALIIQYKHNSAGEREFHDMRVEYNPQKLTREREMALGPAHRFALIEGWAASKVEITMMDIAVDLPVDPRRVMVLSKTGREENRFRGDRYFGSKGEHGRLKVYDKARERREKAGKEIGHELTRVEFTWRGRVRLERLESCELGSNKLYEVKILGEKAEKAEIRAFIAAIQMGVIQLKELTRTNQRKVKEALSAVEGVDLERAFEVAKGDIKRELERVLVGEKRAKGGKKAREVAVPAPVPEPEEGLNEWVEQEMEKLRAKAKV